MWADSFMTSPKEPVSSKPLPSLFTFADSIGKVAPPTEVHARPVITPTPSKCFSRLKGAVPK